MKQSDYAVIVLAAGFSNRMQDFKPLLEIGGQTVADRVISGFLSHNVEVLLVTGWRREDLVTGIRHDGIRIVENPDYEAGMFSSVRAGVRHLSPHHRAFFIMPVDIPLVRPQTIGRLLETASILPEKILYPVSVSYTHLTLPTN